MAGPHRRPHALAAIALVAIGCATLPSAGPVVRIDGSSTVYPLTEAVVDHYLRATPDARVAVGVSGTGGGLNRLCRAEVEIANASRRISPAERAACEAGGVAFVEVPVAYDGITVVVHPGNDWVDHLSVEELGRLWRHQAEGRVMRWSQVRPSFPDRPIALFGAGVDSGTFDAFTEAVTGTPRDSRGDYTASEDDHTLVRGVAGDVGSLGFFGFGYFQDNRTRVRAVPIRATGQAAAVTPSAETIRSGTYAPLSRPVFLYVRGDALARAEVADFVAFYLTHAGPLAASVGFVALPDSVQARVRGDLGDRLGMRP